ncbi:MAG TPA: hypothetical protein VK540_09730 [Polyangiaceae bacterium]|nr:hypothetical protein [Polyangiaceae bacterium]
MKTRPRAVSPKTFLTCFSWMIVFSFAFGAAAQTPPPAEPNPKGAAEATPPSSAPPASTALPVVASPDVAPNVVVPPPIPVPAPVPPAAKIEPAITMNFGVRVGARLQSPTDPEKLDHLGLDTLYLEPRFSARVIEKVGFQANFNVGVPPGAGLAAPGAVGIMDLIAQFDFDDLLHLWAGRLLVPSDRSNFSGPFFMSAWNYPGFYVAGAPLGPKTGPTGRDNGAVVWGDAMKGKFKYYAGAFGLDQPGKPYYTARLNLAIIGSEPGFYHSSTYYGSQDIVAIGAGLQYQQDGSVKPDGTGPKDTVTGMADVLAEFKVGEGVITGEVQYYQFTEGYSFATVGPMNTPVGAPKQAFYALVSYLTPPVGPGKIQPLVRVQRTLDGPGWTILDAFVSYVVKDYDLRVALGYQRTDLGEGTPVGNAIQLGVQLQK